MRWMGSRQSRVFVALVVVWTVIHFSQRFWRLKTLFRLNSKPPSIARICRLACRRRLPQLLESTSSSVAGLNFTSVLEVGVERARRQINKRRGLHQSRRCPALRRMSVDCCCREAIGCATGDIRASGRERDREQHASQHEHIVRQSHPGPHGERIALICGWIMPLLRGRLSIEPIGILESVAPVQRGSGTIPADSSSPRRCSPGLAPRGA
jgi:hypothetical protein